MRNEVQDWTKSRTCPVCGKSFYPAPYHVYKDARNPYKPPVCGYSCMLESRRIKENSKAKARAAVNQSRDYFQKWTPEESEIALEMRAAGKSNTEIAETIGCTEKQVRQRLAYLKRRDRQKLEAEKNGGDADGRS